jgi:hypothetical protein
MPQMDVWSRSCVDAKEIKKQGRQGFPIRPKDCVTDPIPGAKGKSPFFLDEYFSWMSPKRVRFDEGALETESRKGLRHRHKGENRR